MKSKEDALKKKLLKRVFNTLRESVEDEEVTVSMIGDRVYISDSDPEYKFNEWTIKRIYNTLDSFGLVYGDVYKEKFYVYFCLRIDGNGDIFVFVNVIKKDVYDDLKEEASEIAKKVSGHEEEEVIHTEV